MVNEITYDGMSPYMLILLDFVLYFSSSTTF